MSAPDPSPGAGSDPVPGPGPRRATLDRSTKETDVEAVLDLDGGDVEVSTGDAFLDHMVDTLARYAGWGLTLEATGDMPHHLIEDVGIVLGRALRQALEADDAPVVRFGERAVPMDDALVLVAVDLVERPYYDGDVPKRHYDHLLRSLATEARITLHVATLRGTDEHHVTEAAYKALGFALQQALAPAGTALSTKGTVREGAGATGAGGDAGTEEEA